jgi:hypothetical protein
MYSWWEEVVVVDHAQEAEVVARAVCVLLLASASLVTSR